MYKNIVGLKPNLHTIKDTGIRIDLYGSNAEREAFKRRLMQAPNKAVAKVFDEMVSKSIKIDEREADERHKHNQEQYYNKLKLGKDIYDVDIFVDFLEKNNEYRYAGHKTTKISNEKTTRDTQVINHILLTKVAYDIITDNRNNLNPNVTNYKQTFEERIKNGLSEIIRNCKPKHVGWVLTQQILLINH